MLTFDVDYAIVVVLLLCVNRFQINQSFQVINLK